MTRCFRSSSCGALACALVAVLDARLSQAADCAPPSPTASSYTANGCDGTVTGGTFNTGASAYASVLHAVNSGTITVTGPVTLLSTGDESTGAYANNAGAIYFNAPGSTLTTSGAHSNGVHAFGTVTVTGQVNVTTSGERGHALFADYGGVVQMHDSIIVTQGAEAAGIAVATGTISLVGASAITTTGITAPGVALTSSNSNAIVDGQDVRIPIRTTGESSPGAAGAQGSGSMVLRRVDITTEGAIAFGILARNAMTIQADDVTVVTKESGSIGVLASDGGVVTLTGGSVATAGRGAHGLSVEGAGSSIVADGTAVTVSGPLAAAMQVLDQGSIVLSNGSAVSTGQDGSALSMFSTDQTMMQKAEITGSTLAANRGTALAFLGGEASVKITDSSVSGFYLLGIDSRADPVVADVTATRSVLRGAAVVMPASSGSTHAARLSLRDGSTWIVTGDSNLTRLENYGSTVTFVPPVDGVFHSLVLDGYHSVGGTVSLTAALGGDDSPSDRLVIRGGTVTGSSLLRISNAGGKGALTSEGIKVIDAVSGGVVPAGTFALAGRAVAGAFEYRLYRGGLTNPDDGDWYLRSQQMPTPPTPPDPPSPPYPSRPMYRPEVPAYIANEHAAAGLFLHSLQDRMGELPFSSAPASWLRLVGQTAESGSRGNDYSARADTVILQGGGDFARGSLFGAEDRLHVGAMLGYGHVATDGLAAGNDARAKGEVNGYGVGMYATWFGQAASDLGPYVDTWFQYAWFDSNVRGDQLPKVGYHSQAWNVSLEGGWALPLASTSWRVEPQAQVAWLRHLGVNVTEPGGTQVSGGDTNGVVTRLGVRIFRTLDRDDGGRLQPYATLNWWHDQASASVGFSDTVLGQLFPRDRYELKLGINARLTRGWTSWGNIGGQWGSQGYRQYAMRLGARYAW